MKKDYAYTLRDRKNNTKSANKIVDLFAVNNNFITATASSTKVSSTSAPTVSTDNNKAHSSAGDQKQQQNPSIAKAAARSASDDNSKPRKSKSFSKVSGSIVTSANNSRVLAVPVEDKKQPSTTTTTAIAKGDNTNAVSKQSRGGFFFGIGDELSFSAIAGRAKLVLPTTRSTDVPNVLINLMCRQRRPCPNLDPPITLMSEIHPHKRQRVNNAVSCFTSTLENNNTKKNVTCYNRKTCVVLENACEIKQLGELLAGYAELEPVIIPQQHNSSMNDNDYYCYARQGRSSSNVRVLSNIRPQNSILRCSEMHIGKVVQITNGVYNRQYGTIASALPVSGWYTISGLQDDIDIYINAAHLQFVNSSDTNNNCINSLRGMDPSILQHIK